MKKKSIFIISVNSLLLATFLSLMVTASNVLAQSAGIPSRGPSPTYYGNPGVVQYSATPSYNPYVPTSPVNHPAYYGYNNGAYYNPNGAVYGGYPYSSYYGRYNVGGAGVPVYGAPQLINGNYYGINVGGSPSQFWRAPSGFYYPWVGGYAYNSYPIYTMGGNGNGPTQTVPPVSTIISDMDNYLDKAREKGKIDPADYQSLRLRANDLLSKEKALAYEAGGTIDPDEESEIRRDVEGLSAEVARRVKP